ncbi:hypothetical protein BZL29_1641 [Mycobacterium kansasii]|uniref:Uncharacterized protein n=1 Tax=Mycobacterium kansasii TaxID=1768 RepID=A0A1V3XWP0_MYCKA|nr:hypothetical protein BZL29_1641 [Mycobacterium kansasii]
MIRSSYAGSRESREIVGVLAVHSTYARAVARSPRAPPHRLFEKTLRTI